MDYIAIIFMGIVFISGFVMGMVYEHYRIMTRLEDATEEAGEQEKPHCGNCVEYDGDHCMLYWNNAEEDCYIPGRDDKDTYDCCDYWQLDENAEVEE